MTEADFLYILHRLGIRDATPTSLAMRRVLLAGLPYGAAARECRLPSHRLAYQLDRAREIAAGFTVTDAEVAGMTPNEILAYQRQREVVIPDRRDVLRAAGLTDAEIELLIKETT